MVALMKANAALVKERDKALAHAEKLGSTVPCLGAMRSEMKALLLKAKAALLEAGAPKRQKSGKDIPYWYGSAVGPRRRKSLGTWKRSAR
jgi:hypothetical protein